MIFWRDHFILKDGHCCAGDRNNDGEGFSATIRACKAPHDAALLKAPSSLIDTK
jgi:hypothetical protein